MVGAGLLVCGIYLCVYAIIGFLVLYLVESLLLPLSPVPALLYVVLRCLVVILLLLWFLGCVGLMPLSLGLPRHG